MKRPNSRRWPLIGVALMLVIFGLLSIATENSDRFNDIYAWLLLGSAVAFIGLSAAIVVNVIQLWTQYRQKALGTRLTARLIFAFITLAVVPVVVVYYFSVQFLHRGIDSWFDVRVEQALESSLELSRASLDLQQRELLKATQQAVADIQNVPDASAPVAVDELRNRTGADELLLIGQNGRIIAISSRTPTDAVPRQPDAAILQQVRSGQPYIALEPAPGGGLLVRIVIDVPSGADTRQLQALYPFSSRISEMAKEVEQAFGSYREIAYLRTPLKWTFTLTLSLVLLLSLALAVWGAFVFARRLVAPVRDLAKGTRAVAMGDYTLKLRRPADDELGQLVSLFNDMTRRLADARDTASRSKREVEAQRTYLEALLAGLSSGVLSFDSHRVLRTVNASALEILESRHALETGASLADARGRGGALSEFLTAIESELDQDRRLWRSEIQLMASGGVKILMCRGAQLADHGGHVIVFDDVTNLVQAQRDAAWGEVARRLAHEIKNPLTPIQLSAERLRRKCLPKMKGEDNEVFDRSTHTIIQQVESMKDMVNAFSQYARPPQLKTEQVLINNLVRETADLYLSKASNAKLELDLDDQLPSIALDSGRIRQMLHNMIKNAQEAHEAVSQIRISTLAVNTANSTASVELSIEDNGPGLDENMLPHLYEPYVTNKSKGTGLGLAIVKKIVEEHNGLIRHGQSELGGARFTIQFPVRPNDSLPRG